jgi:DNA polymerase I-like protein with 3'-5' exonuclease and polymerase domains
MIQEPLFLPERTWCPPCVFPTLGPVISIDTETYDPHLKQTGPSFKRGEGAVVGIAMADETNTIYLPFGHQGGGNLDKNLVIRYVKNTIANATEVIMANALYDLGWLDTIGIEVPCPVRDIQVAEALLDEERYSYSLDNLASDYLGKGKEEGTLRLAANAYALANTRFDPKSDMWRLHSGHVGAYGEADARYTYDIYPLQLRRLSDENLFKVWELECEVTKALRYMTKMGVPVDQDAAEQLRDEMWKEEKKLAQQFKGVDIWSTDQLAEFLIHHDIKVPKTDKGNYSVTKDFLANSRDPLCQKLNNLRGINRLRKVFVEDTALKGTYRGRIHADFKQTASDEGGTRSGRLSSSHPNMQQVPKRSSWGKRIRSLYVAEPDTLWCKADYSSQEPRLQVHYALLEGLPKAKEAAEAFRKGVKLYTFFEEITGLPYDTCKMLCLGIGYGMGKAKMAETIGVSLDECESILSRFNRHAPFLRQLFDRTMQAASERGYIRTIYGRVAHFNLWSRGYGTSGFYNTPQDCLDGNFIGRNKDHGVGVSKEPEPLNGQIRPERAFTSKALNRLIQGSAADQSKLALVACYKAGMDIRLPVHDEINAMVQNEAEAKQLAEIMEHVIELKVPTVADLDIGRTWC